MNRRTMFLAVVIALTSAGCWLQPGADARRSGFAPLETGITPTNVDQLHFDWSKQFAAPAAAPAVTIDAVYVDSGSNPNASTLYRLDPTDGAVKWSKEIFSATTPFYGAQSPTVAGNAVYVAQTGQSILPSFIQKFDTTTGAPLTPPAGGGHDLTARDGLLISTLASANSSMIAISKLYVNDTTGSRSWNTFINISSPSSVKVPTSAALSDDHLFIGNGSEVRSYPLTKPAVCPVTNNIEICPPDWTQPTTTVSFHPILTSNHQMVIAPTQDAIVALSADTGALQWTGTLAAKPSASPASNGAFIFVPTASGQLAVFSANGCGASTCSPLWTANAESPIGQPPSVTSGGLVYTGSDDGTIHAFPAAGCGSPTCTSLWSVATGSKITGGPVNALGRVLVATADGRIIAYKL